MFIIMISNKHRDLNVLVHDHGKQKTQAIEKRKQRGRHPLAKYQREP